MATKKKSDATKAGDSPSYESLMEAQISVPTKDIEAIVNAVLSGNRVAAVNVANKIREMAEGQNPEVFVRTKVAKGIPL